MIQDWESPVPGAPHFQVKHVQLWEGMLVLRRVSECWLMEKITVQQNMIALLTGYAPQNMEQIMQEHLHTISCILFRVDITPIDTYLL